MAAEFGAIFSPDQDWSISISKPLNNRKGLELTSEVSRESRAVK